MKIGKKKKLASKVLGVGTGRIVFDISRLEEIKEAITKQDIRELYSQGVIKIREKKGRRKIEKRLRRRGPGSIKRRINREKDEYVRLTRKLRGYVKELKHSGKIEHVDYKKLRKEIKSKKFRNKAHLKESIENE